MATFIEIPVVTQEEKVSVNIDQIIYVSPFSGEQTVFHTANTKIVYTSTLPYEEVMTLIKEADN